jgi:23S rRNA (guanosine2251-2'-O)-methyltransferase
MRKRSAEELNRLTPEAFLLRDKTPLVLVLDHVRSGNNTGSAFRTADAFALQQLVLCGITARPPHREILKTAIGAQDTVTWAYYEHTTDALQALRAQGYRIVAVEQTENSIPLQAYIPPLGQPIALVFGNEVQGVSDEALALADEVLEIPQFGTKHSLNVSVCLGIVVWELFRKMNF